MTVPAGRDVRSPAHDAEPRILPLSVARPRGLRPLVEAIVRRHAVVHADVRVSLEFVEVHEFDVDPPAIRALLEPLVAAAFASASAGPAGATDGPRLHEVDVAVVAADGFVDVEIADSGADQPAAERIPAEVRDAAARCGVDLMLAACAAGGMAVTVRFPRRGGRRQAA